MHLTFRTIMQGAFLILKQGYPLAIIKLFIAESPMSQIPAGLQVNNVKFLPVVHPFIRTIGIPQQLSHK